jgi:hypothetical protein
VTVAAVALGVDVRGGKAGDAEGLETDGEGTIEVAEEVMVILWHGRG